MAVAGGMTAGIVLGMVAALHVYWAEGGRWPGRNDREFAEMVIGPDMSSPPRQASWLVATLLTVASGFVVSAGFGSDNRLTVLGAGTAAVVLGLRGAGGMVWSGIVKRESTFARLDRRWYSPLCLVLAGLTAVAVLR